MILQSVDKVGEIFTDFVFFWYNKNIKKKVVCSYDDEEYRKK